MDYTANQQQNDFEERLRQMFPGLKTVKDIHGNAHTVRAQIITLRNGSMRVILADESNRHVVADYAPGPKTDYGDYSVRLKYQQKGGVYDAIKGYETYISNLGFTGAKVTSPFGFFEEAMYGAYQTIPKSGGGPQETFNEIVSQGNEALKLVGRPVLVSPNMGPQGVLQKANMMTYGFAPEVNPNTKTLSQIGSWIYPKGQGNFRPQGVEEIYSRMGGHVFYKADDNTVRSIPANQAPATVGANNEFEFPVLGQYKPKNLKLFMPGRETLGENAFYELGPNGTNLKPTVPGIIQTMQDEGVRRMNIEFGEGAPPIRSLMRHVALVGGTPDPGALVFQGQTPIEKQGLFGPFFDRGQKEYIYPENVKTFLEGTTVQWGIHTYDKDTGLYGLRKDIPLEGYTIARGGTATVGMMTTYNAEGKRLDTPLQIHAPAGRDILITGMPEVVVPPAYYPMSREFAQGPGMEQIINDTPYDSTRDVIDRSVSFTDKEITAIQANFGGAKVNIVGGTDAILRLPIAHATQPADKTDAMKVTEAQSLWPIDTTPQERTLSIAGKQVPINAVTADVKEMLPQFVLGTVGGLPSAPQKELLQTLYPAEQYPHLAKYENKIYAAQDALIRQGLSKEELSRKWRAVDLHKMAGAYNKDAGTNLSPMQFAENMFNRFIKMAQEKPDVTYDKYGFAMSETPQYVKYMNVYKDNLRYYSARRDDAIRLAKEQGIIHSDERAREIRKTLFKYKSIRDDKGKYTGWHEVSILQKVISASFAGGIIPEHGYRDNPIANIEVRHAISATPAIEKDLFETNRIPPGPGKRAWQVLDQVYRANNTQIGIDASLGGTTSVEINDEEAEQIAGRIEKLETRNLSEYQKVFKDVLGDRMREVIRYGDQNSPSPQTFMDASLIEETAEGVEVPVSPLASRAPNFLLDFLHGYDSGSSRAMSFVKGTLASILDVGHKDGVSKELQGQELAGAGGKWKAGIGLPDDVTAVSDDTMTGMIKGLLRRDDIEINDRNMKKALANVHKEGGLWAMINSQPSYAPDMATTPVRVIDRQIAKERFNLDIPEQQSLGTGIIKQGSRLFHGVLSTLGWMSAEVAGKDWDSDMGVLLSLGRFNPKTLKYETNYLPSHELYRTGKTVKERISYANAGMSLITGKKQPEEFSAIVSGMLKSIETLETPGIKRIEEAGLKQTTQRVAQEKSIEYLRGKIGMGVTYNLRRYLESASEARGILGNRELLQFSSNLGLSYKEYLEFPEKNPSRHHEKMLSSMFFSINDEQRDYKQPVAGLGFYPGREGESPYVTGDLNFDNPGLAVQVQKGYQRDIDEGLMHPYAAAGAFASAPETGAPTYNDIMTRMQSGESFNTVISDVMSNKNFKFGNTIIGSAMASSLLTKDYILKTGVNKNRLGVDVLRHQKMTAGGRTMTVEEWGKDPTILETAAYNKYKTRDSGTPTLGERHLLYEKRRALLAQGKELPPVLKHLGDTFDLDTSNLSYEHLAMVSRNQATKKRYEEFVDKYGESRAMDMILEEENLAPEQKALIPYNPDYAANTMSNEEYDAFAPVIPPIKVGGIGQQPPNTPVGTTATSDREPKRRYPKRLRGGPAVGRNAIPGSMPAASLSELRNMLTDVFHLNGDERANYGHPSTYAQKLATFQAGEVAAHDIIENEELKNSLHTLPRRFLERATEVLGEDSPISVRPGNKFYATYPDKSVQIAERDAYSEIPTVISTWKQKSNATYQAFLKENEQTIRTGGKSLDAISRAAKAEPGIYVDDKTTGAVQVIQSLSGTTIGEDGKSVPSPLAYASVMSKDLPKSKNENEIEATHKAFENLLKSIEKFDKGLGGASDSLKNLTEEQIESLDIIESRRATAEARLGIAQQKFKDAQEGYVAGKEGRISPEEAAKYEKAGIIAYSQISRQKKIIEQAAEEEEEVLNQSRLSSFYKSARKIFGGFGLFYLKTVAQMGFGQYQQGFEETEKYNAELSAVAQRSFGVGEIEPYETQAVKSQRNALMSGGGTWKQIKKLDEITAGFGDIKGAVLTGMGAALGVAYTAPAIAALVGGGATATSVAALGGPIGAVAAVGMLGFSAYANAQDYDNTLIRASAQKMAGKDFAAWTSNIGPLTFGSPAWRQENKELTKTWIGEMFGPQGTVSGTIQAAAAIDAHRLSLEEYREKYEKLSGRGIEFNEGAVSSTELAALDPDRLNEMAKVIGITPPEKLAHLQPETTAEMVIRFGLSGKELGLSGDEMLERMDLIGTAIESGRDVYGLSQKISYATGQGAPSPSGLLDIAPMVAKMGAAETAKLETGLGTVLESPTALREIAKIMKGIGPSGQFRTEAGRMEYATGVIAEKYSQLSGSPYEQRYKQREELYGALRPFGIDVPLDFDKYTVGADAWTLKETQKEMDENALYSRASSLGQNLVGMGVGTARAGAFIGAAMQYGQAGVRFGERLAAFSPTAIGDLAEGEMLAGRTQRAFNLSQYAVTDYNLQGQQTGLGLWTTSLNQTSARSAVFNANQIWGQGNWENTAVGQAMTFGINKQTGQIYTSAEEAKAGGTDVVGGYRAYQYQQLYQSAEQQRAQIGTQYAQLELQERYMPLFWNMEDRQRQLGYRQQEWGFGQQEAQMQMQQRQFFENTTQQQKETYTQRGWAQEDWGYQDQTRALQWGWKQEDFAEQSRFMTGRQRKIAERGMERETTMFNLESGQIDKTRDRQKQLWAFEDERFIIQKNQFMEQQRFQEEALAKQREFYEEGKKLTEESVALNRKYQVEQLELQKQSLGLQSQYMEQQLESAKLMLGFATAQDDVTARYGLAKERQTELVDMILDDFVLISAEWNKLAKAMIDGTQYAKPGSDGGGGGGGGGKKPPVMQSPGTQPDRWASRSTYYPANNGASGGNAQTINVYVGNEKLGSFVIDTVKRDLEVL